MSINGKHAYRFWFLKSDAWELVRIEALSRDDFTCAVCSFQSSENDAHHIFYRIKWKDTQRNDLVTLCRDCHDIIHLLTKPKAEVSSRDETAKNSMEAQREFLAARDLMLKIEKAFLKSLSAKNTVKPLIKAMSCFFCSSKDSSVEQIKVMVMFPKLDLRDATGLNFSPPVCRECVAMLSKRFTEGYFEKAYKSGEPHRVFTLLRMLGAETRSLKRV